MLGNVTTVNQLKNLPKFILFTSSSFTPTIITITPKNHNTRAVTVKTLPCIYTRLDLTKSLYPNIMNTHIEGVCRAYIMRFVSLHP